MSDILLYQLFGSPNSTKARIALNYKGIAHEIIDIDFADTERRQLVELSGQPLTPVIRHGKTVVPDSAAIVRYLEANFPDTPKLLFADRANARSIDDWEKWIKTHINEPIGVVFGAAMSATPDFEACAAASARLHEHTTRIERRLAEGDWLVGDHMSLADVTAAPFVFHGMFPEAVAAMHPIAGFFRDHLHLGEGRERTRDWCGRVMAYDRMSKAMEA